MRFLFFVGYAANFLPTARVMFSGSVGAKGMRRRGCWSFFLQTQAQAFFEKSSETDPQTCGLGLSLPIKLIIDAESGLHVLKVTCDRFLSSGVVVSFEASFSNMMEAVFNRQASYGKDWPGGWNPPPQKPSHWRHSQNFLAAWRAHWSAVTTDSRDEEAWTSWFCMMLATHCQMPGKGIFPARKASTATSLAAL